MAVQPTGANPILGAALRDRVDSLRSPLWGAGLATRAFARLVARPILVPLLPAILTGSRTELARCARARSASALRCCMRSSQEPAKFLRCFDQALVWSAPIDQGRGSRAPLTTADRRGSAVQYSHRRPKHLHSSELLAGGSLLGYNLNTFYVQTTSQRCGKRQRRSWSAANRECKACIGRGRTTNCCSSRGNLPVLLKGRML